jgi:hypothetical protein
MNLYSSTMKGLRESKAARRCERALQAATPHKRQREHKHTAFFHRVFSLFGNHGTH